MCWSQEVKPLTSHLLFPGELFIPTTLSHVLGVLVLLLLAVVVIVTGVVVAVTAGPQLTLVP